ncbi:DUF4397 domain-containing protein [Pedobacter sp. MC2016-14]|uniref:DUF4397 domain-containing protein n=1 Tax=Pedobacter sp. MC2016-14 TaxID=2897327 RepID=UPI001E33BCA1|nr:DUF4397 domain-containing protein [Pedobacter sp. MC2016-14]MCD0489747.1 DUF4397 domain-containing protein [Pedobacter sp. MC2016-14]
MKLNTVFFNTRLTRTFLLTAAAGIAILFNACKQDDVVYTPTIAALSIVNASPNSPSLDFYIDNQRVNTNGLLFGDKIEYQRAYQGNRNTSVAVTGAQTPLITKTINLVAAQYHSLYIVGNQESLDYVLLKDDETDPAATKAKVRFVNLSPDAPALNLEVVGDATPFTDLAYKAFTPFKDVTPATATLKLTNKTTGALVATLENVELKKGKTYTIWAKGLVTTTVDAQKLSIKVTEHG